MDTGGTGHRWDWTQVGQDKSGTRNTAKETKKDKTQQNWIETLVKNGSYKWGKKISGKERHGTIRNIKISGAFYGAVIFLSLLLK
jgi:hypothetical protein